ncbi:hypothetical protein N182_09935 [Sinorhizobium sp. GL2]|nr:hypothetical protein N182_09935 [Sinorhizobium sp. GL2]
MRTNPKLKDSDDVFLKIGRSQTGLRTLYLSFRILFRAIHGRFFCTMISISVYIVEPMHFRNYTHSLKERHFGEIARSKTKKYLRARIFYRHGG